MAVESLKAPFPYFGGKSTIASLIWSRLGNVANYIEPFFGSGAVLLLRPDPPQVETCNDLHSYVSNFWRATQHDPEGVVEHADGPVNEVDLHSRHRWLVLSEDAQTFRERMRTDPDYFDVKVAGWWCWGLCCWIGSGWCATPESKAMPSAARATGNNRGGNYHGVHATFPAQQLWQQMPAARLTGMVAGQRLSQQRPPLDAGRGVHPAPSVVPPRRPCLSGPGQGTMYGRGVHAKGDDPFDGSAGTCAARRAWLLDWFGRLRDRLRNVRVCCGDWSRVVGSSSVTTRLGLTGVFLDPPYSKQAKRTTKIYAEESGTVAHDVRAWCLERGCHPLMRICLAGYEGEGHEELEGHGWRVEYWHAQGGYGNRTERGKRNARRERLWFSPHCVYSRGLFDPVPLSDEIPS
jgi:hypothetical protein